MATQDSRKMKKMVAVKVYASLQLALQLLSLIKGRQRLLVCSIFIYFTIKIVLGYILCYHLINFTKQIDECGQDQKALLCVFDEILCRRRNKYWFTVVFHTKTTSIRQNLDADVLNASMLPILWIQSPVASWAPWGSLLNKSIESSVFTSTLKDAIVTPLL